MRGEVTLGKVETFLNELHLEAKNRRDELRLYASLTRMAQQNKKNADPYANSADVPRGKDKEKLKGKEKGKDTCKEQALPSKSPRKAKDSPGP
eukprot:2645198-Amphidinium_carterae.3